jgi:hypothetical protein
MTQMFWMVYGEGQRAPACKHLSFLSAKTEAERLARCNPTIKFFVLCSVSVSSRIDVETKMLANVNPDDGIPF